MPRIQHQIILPALCLAIVLACTGYKRRDVQMESLLNHTEEIKDGERIGSLVTKSDTTVVFDGYGASLTKRRTQKGAEYVVRGYSEDFHIEVSATDVASVTLVREGIDEMKTLIFFAGVAVIVIQLTQTDLFSSSQ